MQTTLSVVTGSIPMSPTPPYRLPVAAFAAALLVLPACSDDSPSTGPDSGGVSRQTAEEIALSVSDDQESFAYTSTVAPDIGARLLGDGPPHFGLRFVLAAGCMPELSPVPPANLDDDGVPDALLLDFEGVSCQTDRVGIEMAGSLGIEDPAVPGFGVRFVFSDLTQALTRLSTGATFTRTWDGTRQVVGSPSNPNTQLTHTITNFVTTLTMPDGATATHLMNWNGNFEADVEGSLRYDAPLPAGTWSFDGNSSWAKGGRAWSVELATTTPIHFDPACDARPRFDAGVVRLEVTRNGVMRVVTISYPECGTVVVSH